MNNIEGPVNIIRLEGRNKILYVFIDVHKKISEQTGCNNNSNIQIHIFLEKIFEMANNYIDFFFEIQPYFIGKQLKTGDRYIDKIFDLFSNNFNINIETDTVYPSDRFEKVRFHYVDIRDYMMIYDFFTITKAIYFDLDSIKKSKNISVDDFNKIKDGIYMLASRIQFMYNTIYSENKKNSNIPTINKTIDILTIYHKKEYKEKIESLIYKLKYKYIYLDVKKVINSILNNEIYNDFKNILNYTSLLIKIIENNVFNIEHNININIIYTLDEIKNLIKIIVDEYQKIVSKITDLYFIRRFLDKSYINKAFVYAGASHTIMYIYVLIKYFNFSITHYSFIKDDVNKIIDELKKLQRFEIELKGSTLELYRYFIPYVNNKVVQCSNISTFPSDLMR